MDLIGIENEGEFFPSGALSDVVKDDLSEITSRWSTLDDDVHPVKRLNRVAAATTRAYRRIRNGTGRERKKEQILDIRHSLLASLGYERTPQVALTAFDGNPVVPLVGNISDVSGQNVVWIVEAPITGSEDEASDPLGSQFVDHQFPVELREVGVTGKPIEEILGEGIFELADGPTHVIVLGLSQIVLVDKRKWPNRSVLRFDLQEIFSRLNPKTLSIMACMISREARVPQQGVPISKRLEEEVQRNANAVTSSLKRTVREAIETLGQEVLDVSNGRHPIQSAEYRDIKRSIKSIDLSRECLLYMYRLLFLFYAEANSGLNLLDMKNPVYRLGYSLEFLREFESISLRTSEDREGTFLWDSLQCTLSHIYEGVDCIDVKKKSGFFLPAAKVSLLDPDSTPILNSLKLRNHAIQKIIRLLSLRSTGRGTGRISYAKLGIGQLGAVYETLISFTGVIAEEKLIEVKPKIRKTRADDMNSTDDELYMNVEDDEDKAHSEKSNEDSGNKVKDQKDYRNDKIDKLEPCRFVSYRRFSEFGPERVVFQNNEVKVYPEGTFIYRLSGRDRERAASYYTPESLARLLVKHALKERCKGLSADELLDLKILEPAMGSAAFLVETTNQLADLYLERKQKEIDRTIPQSQLTIERQRVRSFIADRNCFGVDLNPIAVDLGTISLWLNGLHASSFSPWLGDQLRTGNSLMGARRASYSAAALETKSKDESWLNLNPNEVGWHRDLPDEHIWQWLLPAKGMANYKLEKSMRDLSKGSSEKIKEWHKGDFFQKFKDHEIEILKRLSLVAEELFQKVAEDLRKTRDATNDEITIWPEKIMSGNRNLTYYEKERLRNHVTGMSHAANTLPYKRLKTAMDAWCALWLWPLDKVPHLPSRAEFVHGMAMILEGGLVEGVPVASSIEENPDPSLGFLDRLDDEDLAVELYRSGRHESGVLFYETNVDDLIGSSDWLTIATDIASRENFVHFDLIYADVMKERKGFDLIVGNPPWIKPTWNESKVLADIDPVFEGASAVDVRKSLVTIFDNFSDTKDSEDSTGHLDQFLQNFVSARGEIEITSSSVMNPFVGSGANNLYRCFVDLSFRLVSHGGCAALIHQDGHLSDPFSGEFRQNWYPRIVKYFGFQNKIKSKMFAEVADELTFSLNVYRGHPSNVQFDSICNALIASQVDDSYEHDGSGPVLGLKRDDGTWNTQGHKLRIVSINQNVLSVVNTLSEEEDVAIYQTRFIRMYSTQILDSIRALGSGLSLEKAVGRNDDIELTNRSCGGSSWQQSGHWGETAALVDGYIEKVTAFRPSSEAVLQGPHIYVGNPVYKTPKSISEQKADYDVIDLDAVPDDYFARTNFGPAVGPSEYQRQLPKCSWDDSKSHVDFSRLAIRKMINLNSERSLISAIIPKGVSHVSTVQSIAFKKEVELLTAASLFFSLPLDFFIKASGKNAFVYNDTRRIPWVDLGPEAHHRVLRLSCLTSEYAELWERHAESYSQFSWSSLDWRLHQDEYGDAPAVWCREVGLRNEFARRMALVEIDVLVSQAFGMRVEQLIEIYTFYFPVLQQKEAGTWYDQDGQIVWTCSKGLPGVGYLESGKRPSQVAWDKILAKCPSELSCTVNDDTTPDGPREIRRRFIGPFTRCDRVADYRRAWTHFEKLKAEGGV